MVRSTVNGSNAPPAGPWGLSRTATPSWNGPRPPHRRQPGFFRALPATEAPELSEVSERHDVGFSAVGLSDVGFSVHAGPVGALTGSRSFRRYLLPCAAERSEQRVDVGGIEPYGLLGVPSDPFRVAEVSEHDSLRPVCLRPVRVVLDANVDLPRKILELSYLGRDGGIHRRLSSTHGTDREFGEPPTPRGHPGSRFEARWGRFGWCTVGLAWPTQVLYTLTAIRRQPDSSGPDMARRLRERPAGRRWMGGSRGHPVEAQEPSGHHASRGPSHLCAGPDRRRHTTRASARIRRSAILSTAASEAFPASESPAGSIAGREAVTLRERWTRLEVRDTRTA